MDSLIHANKYFLGPLMRQVLKTAITSISFRIVFSVTSPQHTGDGGRKTHTPASRGRAPAHEAFGLPRSLPSAAPPSASRDAAAEPERPVPNRAKFVARGLCGCHHRGSSEGAGRLVEPMLPLPISGRLLFPLTFRRCRLPESLHELSRKERPR